MKRINIEDAKTNLSKLILDVNENHGPIIIENSKGKNAVLVSEMEWNSINETLKLSGMADDIKNIDKSTKWDKAEIYNPNENW